MVVVNEPGLHAPVEMGALVGFGVGRRLGAVVIRADGAKEGGPELGRAVGVALGDWDGTTVGLALGEATGESVRTADGTEVELVKG
jgi:hypothetical protein